MTDRLDRPAQRPSAGAAEGSGVDFVVNVYERTYRSVLDEERFAALVGQHRHPFAARTILLSNADDPVDLRRRAEALISAGLADRAVAVADLLPRAYAQAGLDRRRLGPVAPFVDFGLAAVFLDGPPWLLHWDAEVDLREPVDWVAPALRLMERDLRVRIANPNWGAPTLDAETDEWVDGFALSRGFSDQAFLVRRSDLARQVYAQRCTARLRFPLS
ncbi:hypothetical protein, partial [Motilibacter deserti]